MSAAIAERERTDAAEGAEPSEAARPSDEATLYERDWILWCFVEADKLRRRRWSELDLPNIIEELETLAKTRRRSYRASYRLVVSHLLKWQYQPSMRSPSWEITIARERDNIAATEEESGTLKAEAQSIVDSAYRSARREAHKETGLPLSAFPLGCPYTLEQLRDEDWMPE